MKTTPSTTSRWVGMVARSVNSSPPSMADQDGGARGPGRDVPPANAIAEIGRHGTGGSSIPARRRRARSAAAWRAMIGNVNGQHRRLRQRWNSDIATATAVTSAPARPDRRRARPPRLDESLRPPQLGFGHVGALAASIRSSVMSPTACGSPAIAGRSVTGTGGLPAVVPRASLPSR